MQQKTTNSQPSLDKLQKVLAQAGVCSRREAERLISEGRVQVNGETAHLGQRIGLDAKVVIDDTPITLTDTDTEEVQVLLYNKPLGVICSRNDPQGRKTIFDSLPELENGRWITVGRLDINSSGLLLLTNNGKLAHRLMHPSYEVTRIYRVRVNGEATFEELAQLRQGIMLEDGLAKFDKVNLQGRTDSRNNWYEVELHEGKNREVRRIWQALGYRVNRLVRIKYANVNLPRSLEAGEFIAATDVQIKALQKSVGL